MSPAPMAVVTGGAGFLGSHMVDLLLESGFRVRVIDNLAGGRLANLDRHKTDPRLEVDLSDIRDARPGSTLFAGARYVFHFAGIGDIVPSIEKPVEYVSVNVMGTVAALEAARAAGVAKFVYAASSSCYGIATELPTTEGAPIHPEYPYALSKWMGEEAVLHWGRVYRLPVVSIRIFNAYGPRSRTSGAYGAVFGVFLAQKLAGRPLTIVGDGTQTRDFVFATDLVRAFLAAAQSDRTHTWYNAGAGSPQSVNRLAQLLGGETVHVPKRPGEPDCTWADISKIRRELGWTPQVPFETGVAEMLAHIQDWRHAPVWDPDSIAEATNAWFAVLSGRRS
ncbi:MAG: GDP-mannose 4,6-dehydratase [Acidobacteriota bacterium]